MEQTRRGCVITIVGHYSNEEFLASKKIKLQKNMESKSWLVINSYISKTTLENAGPKKKAERSKKYLTKLNEYQGICPTSEIPGNQLSWMDALSKNSEQNMTKSRMRPRPRRMDVLEKSEAHRTLWRHV